jgi:hypothetical protein
MFGAWSLSSSLALRMYTARSGGRRGVKGHKRQLNVKVARRTVLGLFETSACALGRFQRTLLPPQLPFAGLLNFDVRLAGIDTCR